MYIYINVCYISVFAGKFVLDCYISMFVYSEVLIFIYYYIYIQITIQYKCIYDV